MNAIVKSSISVQATSILRYCIHLVLAHICVRISALLIIIFDYTILLEISNSGRPLTSVALIIDSTSSMLTTVSALSPEQAML